MTITVSSIDHQVYLIGATANQLFNLSYTMALQYETNVIAIDTVGSVIVHADSTGYWEHLANGTGDMTQNCLAYTGWRSFKGYAIIADNTGSVSSSTDVDEHHATIQNP